MGEPELKPEAPQREVGKGTEESENEEVERSSKSDGRCEGQRRGRGERCFLTDLDSPFDSIILVHG